MVPAADDPIVEVGLRDQVRAVAETLAKEMVSLRANAEEMFHGLEVRLLEGEMKRDAPVSRRGLELREQLIGFAQQKSPQPAVKRRGSAGQFEFSRAALRQQGSRKLGVTGRQDVRPEQAQQRAEFCREAPLNAP
jgi:hypothetical protein